MLALDSRFNNGPVVRTFLLHPVWEKRTMHLLLKIVPKTPTQKRAVFLLLLFSLPSMLSSKTRIVNATIDTSKTGAPILKNIYGQFLERAATSPIDSRIICCRSSARTSASQPIAVRWQKVGAKKVEIEDVLESRNSLHLS